MFKITNILKLKCDFEVKYLPYYNTLVLHTDLDYQRKLEQIEKYLGPTIDLYLEQHDMDVVNELKEYQKQFNNVFSEEHTDDENNKDEKKDLVEIIYNCLVSLKDENNIYPKYSSDKDDLLKERYKYKHIESYTVDQILDMINQANKIGECVYQLLNKIFKSNPQRFKYEFKLKDNSEDVKRNISNDPFYRYLLIRAYNNKYTSKYVKLEVDDYFLLSLNNFYYYNEKTKEMQWYDYKNDNINEVYEKIQIEHEKELKELESTIVYNLHFNDISQTIIKVLMSQFNENRTLYKNFTNLIGSFINKFGLPNFIQPSLLYNYIDKNTVSNSSQSDKNKNANSNSSRSFKEKMKNLSKYIIQDKRDDLSSFLSLNAYELNNIIIPICPAIDEIDVHLLNINLNDFIQTCFIIYILIELKKPTPKEKKDEILLTILSQSFHLNDYTTKDILHLLEEHNIFDMIDTTHANRTELPKSKEYITKIETAVETYEVKIGVYSCIHDCLFDIFMKLYNRKGNLKLQQEHAFQCAKCHEFYFTKGHVIKNINISKYKVYLCDDCFNDREKKLAQKRKQKFNENKKNVHS